MYEFMESRLGKVAVRDHRLVFSENADLEIFRSLSAQLAAESEREKALAKENEERRRKAMQSFR